MHIRKHTARFCIVFLSLLFCLVIFTANLVYIQLRQSDYLAELAQKQHIDLIDLEPVRGAIYDRMSRPLAFNVTASSLYVNPRSMTDVQKQVAARELTRLLGADHEYIKERLARNKYFVWIKRKLPASVVDQIKDLKLKGVHFIKESKRYYPNQALAAHVIGFAGVDNQGLEGLELQYNEELSGKKGWSQILRDARQRHLLIEKKYVAPQDGFSLVLTIDETIQYLAERALDKAYKKYNAKWGSIILMDPKTGEILAMANRPTYDLSDVAQSEIGDRTNRALSFTYEPGSVFKIVVAAAALEEGIFTETDTIDCENGSYRIANHTLHDHHPHGDLTFREVIEQSSNIGVAKIAQKLGKEKFYNYARRFRFGLKTDVGLAGEIDGVLKKPNRWSKTSIGAIPMGQEVTVTPLQLVCAVSTIANDGVFMQPFVVKYVKDNKDQVIKTYTPKSVDKVISEETAHRLKAILAGVVESGTGKRAQIEGISVAGKTGTAQKVEDGTYSHSKFFATFIGFAPLEDPKIAAVVVFDEPKPSYYGGTVAAPVFQEVVRDTLKYLSTIESQKNKESED